MNKPKYQISLALNSDEKQAVNELMSKGITMISIFRKGLEVARKENK